MQTSTFRVAKRTPDKRHIGVRAACGACRSRKLACDGQRPRCSRCQKRGEPECSYVTESPDETRTHAMRREMNRMRTELQNVGHTLTALKDLPADAAARLVIDVLNDENPMASLINVGLKIQIQSSNLSRQMSVLASMQATFPNTKSCVQFELFLYFPKWYPPLTADEVPLPVTDACEVDFFELQTARGRYLTTSPQFSPISSSLSWGDQQQSELKIASWNVRIQSFCLRCWTNVPMSLGLAERAMNAYLRTDHVLFGFMDTELFLHDLIRCEDRYCSVALVNAVLHYGCLKIARCDFEAAAAVDALRRETESTLQSDSCVSVAGVAALNIHYVATVFTDSLEQAAPFLDRAIALCNEVCGWFEPSAQYQAWCKSAMDERAMAQVMWSVSSSGIYRGHRWGDQAVPPIPRLPVPFLDPSTRAIVTLSEGSEADLERIACERYILAAVSANLPYVRESVMLHLTAEPLSEEDRAYQTASIYRRALDNTASIPRPRALHAQLTDIAAISQMWSHFWILSLFQPLTHHRGAIPGFQASQGTAGAVFTASARQLQHMVFLYRRHHLLTPPTVAWHGPIFVAAVALTQVRHVTNRAHKFEVLLWLFADLAISFPGLRKLLQSLALTGYSAGLVDVHQIRALFRRFSDMCQSNGEGNARTKSISAAYDPRATNQIAAALRERSYDTHFATSHVIDLPEDEEEGPA